MVKLTQRFAHNWCFVISLAEKSSRSAFVYGLSFNDAEFFTYRPSLPVYVDVPCRDVAITSSMSYFVRSASFSRSSLNREFEEKTIRYASERDSTAYPRMDDNSEEIPNSVLLMRVPRSAMKHHCVPNTTLMR